MNDIRRITPEELPLDQRDKVLQQKRPRRPIFLKRMIRLAREKKANSEDIRDAFNEVSTIMLMPDWFGILSQKDKLSLSEAFAFLLEPFSLKQRNKLKEILFQML